VRDKLTCSLLVAGMVVIGMSAVGYAQSPARPAPPTRAVPVAPETQFHRVSPPTVYTQSAPEIDPRSATAALAMLAGGILVIRARRRS
jgi:hypothetical protein